MQRLMDEELAGTEEREEGQERGLRTGISEAVQRQREEKKKEVKPRKPVKVLRAEDLMDGETGFRLLYKEMLKKNERLCKLAEMQPERALQDYMSTVKEWAFSVAPKYEFDYFVDRVQTLGRKKEVVDEMNILRRYHKGELIYDKKEKKYMPRILDTEARINFEPEREKVTPNNKMGIIGEPAVPRRDEYYDPAKDPEREPEGFVDAELLAQYSIKKKVKINSIPEKDSPNQKVRMDLELPHD